MRQTFSKATPSLSQECEWEGELQRLMSASAWWCILCPEPPSSPLQQLSRPGTKAEAWWRRRRRQLCSILHTTPTLPHCRCTPIINGFHKSFSCLFLCNCVAKASEVKKTESTDLYFPWIHFLIPPSLTKLCMYFGLENWTLYTTGHSETVAGQIAKRKQKQTKQN